jgi:hypothetical protein
MFTRFTQIVRDHPIWAIIAIIVVISIVVDNSNPNPDISSESTSVVSTTSFSDAEITKDYSYCLKIWAETNAATSNSVQPRVSTIEEIPCIRYATYCDDFSNLQMSLKALTDDIELGFAIPSDIADPIKEYADQFGSPTVIFAEKDHFYDSTRAIVSGYRALRVAYLTNNNKRIKTIEGNLVSLVSEMKSLCEPVPELRLDS